MTAEPTFEPTFTGEFTDRAEAADTYRQAMASGDVVTLQLPNGPGSRCRITSVVVAGDEVKVGIVGMGLPPWIGPAAN